MRNLKIKLQEKHNFSCSVLSNYLQSHGLQNARLSCPLLPPGTCSNSCLLTVMWYNHLILFHLLLFPPSIFPSIRVLSKESLLHNRWPKYCSISLKNIPSNEQSGLVSFRIDWFDLAVQGTQEPSPTPQFKKINSSVLSFLYSATLTSIHDYQKNHSFDQTDLCR